MICRLVILTFLLHIAALPALAASSEALFKADSTCSRTYIYRNRTFPVDSSRKLDAEGLRPVFKKAPASEALLNDYQGRLKSSYMPAYIGTLGVLMAVGGPLYAGTKSSEIGKQDTRALFLYPGLFLAVASYFYGQFAIKEKEKTLEKAVETYNDAVPGPERIRVGLTPVSDGAGGEIKTVVPF